MRDKSRAMRLEKKVSWPKPLILSEADAANMLNIAPRTLQAKRLDGSGPAFVQLTKRRIGYAVSDLEAWIETCRYKTTKEAKSSYDQNQELMRKY